MANALGSGVADRLWLQPFLADAARHLLGETLELASIDTWWCGDRDRLAAVRADPRAFVFHDTDPVSPAASVFGDELSDSETIDWLDRMTAAPHRYVVQPKIEFASTPVAIDGELRSGTSHHPCADRADRRRGRSCCPAATVATSLPANW